MRHVRNYIVPISLVAALALVLAACGGPQVGGSYTASQTTNAINETSSSTSAVVGASLQSDAGLAVQAPGVMSAPGISSGGNLPTGTWTWSQSSSSWGQDSTSPATGLILNWTFTGQGGTTKNATLTIDWQVGGTATINVDNSGTTQEVPRHASATLDVGGTEVGSLDVQVGWQNTTCGKILEPATASASGYLGDASNKITLESFDLGIPQASGTLSSSGKITATSASSGDGGLQWNVNLDGTAKRSSTDCTLTEFDTTSGHISFGLNSPSHSMSFAVDFSNMHYDSTGALTSVDLTGGNLKVDGATAVTFTGRLDDANGNGVWGDNVTLHFSGKTMSLEAYLQNGGVTTVAISSFTRMALGALK